MTDVFDQASTLNFTTVATVRGPLGRAQLEWALRCLEQRHPLLKARIDRGSEVPAFFPGEGAPISFVQHDGGLEAIRPLLDASLDHRDWTDDGPRAELTWLRHSEQHSTLLLCLHHTVSDGSSGIIAMRDLLSFLHRPQDKAVEEQIAPPQTDFFPPLFEALRAKLLASLQQPQATPSALPWRLRTPEDVPFEQRSAKTIRIQLDDEQSRRLSQHARQLGASVHGVLCASLSLALAAEPNATSLQRFAHPVSLRRYLQSHFPQQPAIPDAVGYYVSSVQTDHTVSADASLADLARDFSSAVRAKKDEHEPLLSAPVRGPMVAQRAAKLGLPAFRTWAEQKVFTGSAAISNLGELEKLGVKPREGALEIDDFYFAIACSVMGALGASAVSFRGKWSLHLTYMQPLIEAGVMQRIAERTKLHLLRVAS